MVEKSEKYLVLKWEELKDIYELFPETEAQMANILVKHTLYRKFCAKSKNNYIVVNQDESYAEELWKFILDSKD